MPLTTHFVNVGKGNCTIIDPPSERLTVIDIDDSRTISELDKTILSILGKAKLTNPLDYLDQNFPHRTIFRFILTHPDMDHMSGIQDLFSRKTIINFWDIEHNRELNDWKNDSPYDKNDWEFYKKLRSGNVPGLTLIQNKRGSKGNYWTDDSIEILHPHNDSELRTLAEQQDVYDHLSHVLKISHAGKSILLCGDASKEALEHIFNDPSVDYTATILFAPGHGSENSVYKEMIDRIGHKLTIVSVAEGVNYARDYYSKFGPVLSTKHHGNIHFHIDDSGGVYFITQQGNYSDQWYILN